MRIQVLSAKKYAQKLKVTVHASGKLGFSDDTAKEFRLKEREVYVKFLVDEDTHTMYMSVIDYRDDDAFKVLKSGEYYYVTTTQMFTDLGLDYKTQTVIYDRMRCKQFDTELGGEIYQMNPRILKRRQKNVE